MSQVAKTYFLKYILVMTILVIAVSFFSLDYAGARGGDSGGDAIVTDGLDSVKIDDSGNDAPVPAVTSGGDATDSGGNRRGRDIDTARTVEDSGGIDDKPIITESSVPAIEVKPITTQSSAPAIEVKPGAITSGSANLEGTPVKNVLTSDSAAPDQNSLVTDQQKSADNPSATNSLDGVQFLAVVTASLGALTAIAGVVKTMVRAK